ncbi:MAG: alpha-galactosidase, partial [Bacilli bacterium]|nr:alpha-galactosidase [Bacilli bacterium]
MSIHFDPVDRTFHLQAKDTSYVFQIIRSGYLAHLYWGRKIRNANPDNWSFFQDKAFSPNPEPADRTFSLDTLPQEFPGYGNTDLRSPVYQVQLENGTTITDLRYVTHRVFQGKPKLEGLPATYVETDHEAETLEVELFDALIGLKVILSYTVFANFNVITRSAQFRNEGSQRLKLLRALSMSVDFHDADYDLLHLSGAWARERHVVRRALAPGNLSI